MCKYFFVYANKMDTYAQLTVMKTTPCLAKWLHIGPAMTKIMTLQTESNYFKTKTMYTYTLFQVWKEVVGFPRYS